jgi:hypothetical protein
MIGEVRAAAGDRADDIEYAMNIFVVGTRCHGGFRGSSAPLQRP